MANTLPGTPYVESSDLVANYPAVSEDLAERVDLVGILPFADSTARGTALPTPTDGQYSYLQDTNSTEVYNGAAWLSVGGKVLQVVRATDTTNRTTNSTSFVDVTGMSVTITPKKSDSEILLTLSASWQTNFTGSPVGAYGQLQLTDDSNNAINGAEGTYLGDNAASSSNRAPAGSVILIGRSTPGITSATTYKARFRSPDSTLVTFALLNSLNTAQLYAIEVSS